MRVRIQPTILVHLCCLAFYGGTQLVGETEAAFSSGVSPDSITMKAALVFPVTIQELENTARKVSESMEQNVKTIVAPSPDASMEELQKHLDEVTAMKEELTRQMGILHQLYEEMSTYQMEIQKQEVTNAHTYDYVREGFAHVDRMLKRVQATVDFSQIEEVCSSIQVMIGELVDQEERSVEEIQTDVEAEQPSVEGVQADPSSIDQTRTNPESPEPQDETPTEITKEGEGI